MLRITDPQKAALKWLKNRGGDGVFDMTRCLIARGERAGVMRSTWSRREALGLIERYNKRRVRVTDAGTALDTSRVQEADCA